MQQLTPILSLPRSAGSHCLAIHKCEFSQVPQWCPYIGMGSWLKNMPTRATAAGGRMSVVTPKREKDEIENHTNEPSKLLKINKCALAPVYI